MLQIGSSEISDATKKYEHIFNPVQDLALIRRRRLRRLVYLYWLMKTHEVGKHSRANEFFFSNEEVLLGKSPEARIDEFHPEHIVPCAFIRDRVLEKFDGIAIVRNNSEDYVAMELMINLIGRRMGVVNISKLQAKQLDRGQPNLKVDMPPGWDVGRGCIFARLCSIGVNVLKTECAKFAAREYIECSDCPSPQMSHA